MSFMCVPEVSFLKPARKVAIVLMDTMQEMYDFANAEMNRLIEDKEKEGNEDWKGVVAVTIEWFEKDNQVYGLVQMREVRPGKKKQMRQIFKDNNEMEMSFILEDLKKKMEEQTGMEVHQVWMSQDLRFKTDLYSAYCAKLSMRFVIVGSEKK